MDIKIIDAQVLENSKRIQYAFSNSDFSRFDTALDSCTTMEDRFRVVCSIADTISNIVTPNSACRNGCSECCYQPVFLSPIEVVIISDYKRISRLYNPIINDKQSMLEAQKKYMGVKCPFLLNSKCSIYPVRPLVCRLHFNLSNISELCDTTKVEGDELSVPMLDYDFLMPLLSEFFKSCRFDIHQFVG